MGRQLPYGVADGTPHIWDKVSFNDLECPGVASVEIERTHKKDDKQAKGSNGSQVSYAGVEPAKVKVGISYLTEEEHAFFLDKVVKILDPNPDKKKVEAVKLNHAVATARNVTAITIDKLSGPSFNSGAWTWSIEATESRPPTQKNATGTFKGAPPPKDSNCQALSRSYTDAVNNARNERAQAQAKRSAAQNLESFGAFDNFGVESAVGGTSSQILKLRDEADQHENIAKAYDAQAATVYSMMVGSKCLEAPPSGNSTTTGPTVSVGQGQA